MFSKRIVRKFAHIVRWRLQAFLCLLLRLTGYRFESLKTDFVSQHDGRLIHLICELSDGLIMEEMNPVWRQLKRWADQNGVPLSEVVRAIRLSTDRMQAEKAELAEARGYGYRPVVIQTPGKPFRTAAACA